VPAENVATARLGYELWNRGDMDEFVEYLHPDFTYTTSGVFPGFDPVYRGREGMLRFRDTMLEAWKSFILEPTEIAARGDHVIVAVRFLGTGRESGADVSVDFHHVQHFRDGLVDRLSAHADRAGALQAAGLRPGGP
jgi:ketosteroid isomerase-like protein